MKRLQMAPEEADIVDLTHDAAGVARIDGKTVFVADSLPGERVVLRRTHRQRKLDYAITEQVLRASPDRVQPKCPHFGRCGGCALQHLAPDAQLAFKQLQLIENLSRLGAVQAGRLLNRSVARSGITAGARASASSSCHARARCWSDSASVRRRT